MTAEIAIMNREAVALAADSAITVGGDSGQKIFGSGNKLFALSKYHPVGIMVYGSAIFMEVPWETIVKVYRKKLGSKGFDTLKEYAEDFIGFLDGRNPLFPDLVQRRHLRASVSDYFRLMKGDIVDEIERQMREKAQVGEHGAKEIISRTIKEHHDIWTKAPNTPSLPRGFAAAVLHKYRQVIDEAIDEVFEKAPVSADARGRLRSIAASLFCKAPERVEYKADSGVVVAGFGGEEVFPSLRSVFLEGVVNDRLKYKEHISTAIGFDVSASIIPFAQREMVATFMEGADPSYLATEETYLSELLDGYAAVIAEGFEKYSEKERTELAERLAGIGRDLLAERTAKLAEHRREAYTSPVTGVVSMLPKDELAAMAESLVSLTSFKRKVTMESETVGGPIDVALISKGDGLIWIKRKHYFKPELNPQFLANYWREDENE